ncbi:DNA phosphorothioation-associated putative methyltransferase [Sphingomonas sp. dw_22]|uniref:DNA phosphorothioation-associated putative methyltransferase n=1 Tax=Sphingomonas sp. dw_22 TaxID=2721175 RepID=UPI001BD24104
MTIDVPISVARHRTAMVRHSLSQPVSLLVRHGLLRAGVSIFDYGCGQGDDLRVLVGGGIEATGWDPHFAPDAVKTAADVVNLGFVLNVIERPEERVEALKEAWNLTRTVLAISTMIVGQVPVSGLSPYRDGYVTSRGTFQKYFKHAELRHLISHTLGIEPVAAAPGIFFAFRNNEELAEYLLSRRSWRNASTTGFQSRRERTASRAARPDVAERISDEVSELIELLLERGRPPQIDELPARLLDRLAEQRVSLGRALDIARSTISHEDFTEAQDHRREDLIVHRALSMLNPGHGSSSQGISRDIRVLFGSQGELATQAKDYLFGLADADRMRSAVEKAVKAKMGVLDDRGRFVFTAETLNNLPGALRCYAGCVTHLSGEPAAEFIYRLDPVRKCATLIVLDDDGAELPTSSHDVRIDLKRQDVSMVEKRRRLLRKADLYGLGPKTKQRGAEKRYREANDLAETAVFETIS